MRQPEPEPQSFDRVLSSMCTEPHPAARAAAERFLATNPGDPATYEAVAELEARAVEGLATLAEHPTPADATGYVTSGGTEANIQAVRSARNRHGESDDTSGERDVNVVAPASAHFSFTKAAALLDVELRTVPVDDEYRADPDAVAAAVDDGTALVVAVAGSTEHGRVDPIPELAAIADEAGARVHVDAAWGGFVLPFTDRDWSFADAPVDTVTIDPHKFGQAPVPAGGLLAREDAALDALAVDTPYLESRSQATLTGTRSGAGVAGAVAAMDALWPDGYREAAERAADNADWLAAELADRGYDVVDPELPLVVAAVPESEFAALRDAGWKASRTGTGALRVVCMPHVTRATLRAFLDDLDGIRR
ncbi:MULTISPECIES: tyrosine decarboxylase MfnA [Halorubrum]|uniref:Probable L-aspartate decarboxylase n=1 Tax=Halorubrum sodomense TaxID=35743 RepID=A0A1I6G6H2_HALSD|nr:MULTISPECIES: tyrosine decarboxylase MfnA [Halorubrum]TKX53576.1 tyrosine decarboxylase MfnA [Halorubrum sp. SP3]TKX68176.1 tyrosine decarboxylase MfnA [Halorubrum sp. SP9]SFR37721.1 tyrosine decarboxylase / aspartate 1-decarboxylase [Halorubrum sodomense]